MFACVCPMNLCCFVYMYETLLYCLHVWMVPGKISCKLTGSTSLNKVSELNWIEYTRMCVYFRQISKMFMSSQVHVYLRNKTFRFHISFVHILKVLARTSKIMHPHLIHVHIRTHTNTHAYTQTRTHTRKHARIHTTHRNDYFVFVYINVRYILVYSNAYTEKVAVHYLRIEGPGSHRVLS